MKRVLAVICLAAAIMGLFPAAQTENTGPSSRMHSYSAGKYEVGKNLKAGEYILFSAPLQTGFFAVIADMESMDLITKGSFEVNTFLTVEEGDWLIIANCIAIFANDYYRMRKIKLNETGGMLKVGVDARAGDYELTSLPNKTSVYRIYNDSRYRLVVEEREFRSTSHVTLEDGQYLELINCFAEGLLPEETATPRPAPKPTSEPAPDSPDAQQNPMPDMTATPAPTAAIPSSSQRVRIDPKKSPKVRSIPSTMGEQLGLAKAGSEYELLEIGERWYKIRLENGVEGWVIAGMAEIIK